MNQTRWILSVCLRLQPTARILKTLSSGLPIDVERFRDYCSSTAALYVECYSWYFMPPTVNKILIHGASIVKAALLPIGQLSEEALESRHKDIRRFRDQHSRKFSRMVSFEDIFRRLLLSWDPIISSSAPSNQGNMKVSKEARNLLLIDEKSESDRDSDEIDSDDDDL